MLSLLFGFVYLIGLWAINAVTKLFFKGMVCAILLSALQDFVMGLSILLRGTIQEKLNWAFNLYDINKDGYITKEVGPVKHCQQ